MPASWILQGSNNFPGSSGATLDFQTPVPAGAAVWVWIGRGTAPTGHITSVSDGTNTYVKQKGLDNGGAGPALELWVADNIQALADLAVTFAANTSADTSMAVFVAVGQATPSVGNISAGATTNGAFSDTVTPSGLGDLIFSGLCAKPTFGLSTGGGSSLIVNNSGTLNPSNSCVVTFVRSSTGSGAQVISAGTAGNAATATHFAAVLLSATPGGPRVPLTSTSAQNAGAVSPGTSFQIGLGNLEGADPIASGDSLYIVVGHDNSTGATISSVTDTSGAKWVPIASVVLGNLTMVAYTAQDVGAIGTTTITVDLSASIDAWGLAFLVRFQTTFSAQATSGTGTGSTAGIPVQAGSAADFVVLVAAQQNVVSSDPTVIPPLQILQNSGFPPPNNGFSVMGWQTAETTGPFTPSVALSNPSPWAVIVLDAGGAVTPVPPPPTPTPTTGPTYTQLIDQPCVAGSPASLTPIPTTPTLETLPSGPNLENLPGTYYDRCDQVYRNAQGQVLPLAPVGGR